MVDSMSGFRPETARSSLRLVASAARRRAVRAGDREVDTGHLLHSILEADPAALLAAAPAPAQAGRLMGYLAQRSIGFGRRWQSVSESSAEAADWDWPSGWSRTAARALERARERARSRGVDEADGMDLLAELASDPGSRAVEILRAAGIDPVAVVSGCRLAELEPAAAEDGTGGGLAG
ncbi:Clp protease N-terminal domain-containing protein [Phaeacidiphilus oryzae]|uniref:Clp protease N-terminal domain-containing protein n=1 Tax=Phaeacidiphilus oryzae TaxID=348818 RepID=UPI0007C82FE9|nr:Clp protease N-terminal domain-containing protein [Phaeacidiphilus oryzae]